MNKIINVVNTGLAVLDFSSRIIFYGLKKTCKLMLRSKLNDFKPVFRYVNGKVKRIKYVIK